MRRHARLVTPPAIEPVTLAEMKAFVRVEDDHEDALLIDFITAARVAAEDYTRRAFLLQSWRLSLDLPVNRWVDDLPDGVYDLPVTALSGDLPREIGLERPPLINVVSVTTYDLNGASSVFANTNYTVDSDGGRLVLNPGASWPSSLRPQKAVTITTTNGYGPAASDVPKPIKTAIMIHAAKLHESRGLCGEEMPDAAKRMLRQYRIERL